MNTKNIIYTELEEEGTLSIPDVLDKVFPEKPEFREEVTEKLEKYNISEAEITPQNTATLKRYEKQCLSTDTGVEIKIPMEQYRSGDSIEFITNEDGSISILIKNIGHITSKMSCAPSILQIFFLKCLFRKRLVIIITLNVLNLLHIF